MDVLPVNRLLQLLRQKPAEPLGPDPPVLCSTPSPEASLAYSEKSDTQPATQSDTQYVTKRSTQPATKRSIQSAQRSTQPATKRSTPLVHKSNTQSATENDEARARAELSKGQQRVLRFLLSNRDTTTPSQTMPVGYDAISRYCILSRSGSRKVIGELGKKGLIARLDTKRGETQGSIYFLASGTLSTTQSDAASIEKSSTLSATQSGPLCSSSKKLLLQGLVLEDAFQDLNPRSLLPYLDQFDTVEELQNFLDVANACIIAAKEGQGKPIQNPPGFLIAQLRTGYINPPEGYKSRKVRAQELLNQQLEEELATLRGLQEREQELRCELFVAQLTAEDLARLKREAQAHVKPHLGLSPPFQLKMHKEVILKEWFAQHQQLPQDGRGDL